jgi:putative membrane protein
MMFPWYGDIGYMGWMMVGWVIFWVMLVALAVFAILRLGPRERGDDAVAILKERLARGEITPDEYQSRRGLILSR